jgi:hypothetical protein
VKEFQAAANAEGAVLTKESMSDLVNKVHARYQVVEKVFE